MPNILRHAGRNGECPICGYRCRDWRTIGEPAAVNRELRLIGAGTRQAGCYWCLSTDKERLLYLYFTRVFKIPENTSHYTVLHCAPELCLYKLLRRLPTVDYIPADLCPEKYPFAKHIRKIDLCHIDLISDSIDLIIANHILEHIPDDRQAMKELYRILKPGGKALLQVPISQILEVTIEDFAVTDEREREARFGQSDHCRIYGRDYFERLASAGFSVEQVDVLPNSSDKEYYGLNPHERLFLATKPLSSFD
jgi:SAM-dependent methyltransferase